MGAAGGTLFHVPSGEPCKPLGPHLGLWPLGGFAWAVLVLGWTLAVLLAHTDSPSMVQANVSSVSPYSPFMLDTGHHGSGSELARGGHGQQHKSWHSSAREGICRALEHIQCTESAALLPSLLNPRKRREKGLS